jgi:hypothetical protein
VTLWRGYLSLGEKVRAQRYRGLDMIRILFGLVVVAGLSGCSTARYVERSSDSGTVGIATNTDTWPGHNRTEAIALIEKHVGPNYVIVDEHQVTTEQRAPYNPDSSNTSTMQTITEWQIKYKRANAVAGGVPQAQATPGSAPVVNPPSGIVPSVGPTAAVVPAH